MTSCRNKELVFLILQFLDEEKFKDTFHKLEQESGVFFNMKYFEDEVRNGNWDEVERYLLGFTKSHDNLYSMKMFDEIRKQKYKEGWDKYLDALEITQFLKSSVFRENKKLKKYGHRKSARTNMLVEMKKLIQANPLFHDKLQFPPNLNNSRLQTLINQDQEKHILGLQEDLMRMQKEKEAKERELSELSATARDLWKKLDEKEKEQAEQQSQIERLEKDNAEAIKQLDESLNKLRKENKELQEKHEEALEKHKNEVDKSYATTVSELGEMLKSKYKEQLSEAVAAADEEVVSLDTTLNLSSRKKTKVEPNKRKFSSLSETTIKEKAGKKASGAKDKLKDPVDPSEDELRNTISDILKEIDFNSASFTGISKQLGGKKEAIKQLIPETIKRFYGLDLTHKMEAIKQLIQEELTKLCVLDD